MRYKPFGNTGMEVSELTLGTWGIGGAGWDQRSEEDRLSAIRTALECGVNLIDTAPAYNAGAAERYVGRVLEEMGMRQKVYVATKCGTEFIGGAYVRDCSAEVVIRECESSLRNLRTDYIDLYLIHWPDGKTPLRRDHGRPGAPEKAGEDSPRRRLQLHPGADGGGGEIRPPGGLPDPALHGLPGK